MAGRLKVNSAQWAFLVFVVLPSVLAYLIYEVDVRVNYRTYPPGSASIESWNTWYAYEHPGCYVAAVLVWFAAIWIFLWRRSRTSEP